MNIFTNLNSENIKILASAGVKQYWYYVEKIKIENVLSIMQFTIS